jgi:hypothetical protein
MYVCVYICVCVYIYIYIYIYIYRLRWSRGSVLAFSTQVRGFKPGRSRRIFWAKKFSARLPSEGKESRRSHVVDLRHVKYPYIYVEVGI